MTESVQPVPMEIKGLMLDPSSNVPIVVLRDADDTVFLPIWIGAFEANAIALRLEGIEPPRPMTHDLLRAVLGALDTIVKQIVITDLRENTFYASAFLTRGEDSFELDCRPSDAIALALRTEAPILVMPAVLEKAKAVTVSSDLSDEEKIRRWLEQAGPEDLGDYEM